MALSYWKAASILNQIESKITDPNDLEWLRERREDYIPKMIASDDVLEAFAYLECEFVGFNGHNRCNWDEDYFVMMEERYRRLMEHTQSTCAEQPEYISDCLAA